MAPLTAFPKGGGDLAGAHDNVDYQLFPWADYACRCGCDKIIVSKRLVRAYRQLWSSLQGRHNLRCNSGYRCPQHNAKVAGASKTSRHMVGDALDLSCPTMKPSELAVACEKIPAFEAGAIGIYTWGVHVDLRPVRHRFAYGPDGKTYPYEEAKKRV